MNKKVFNTKYEPYAWLKQTLRRCGFNVETLALIFAIASTLICFNIAMQNFYGPMPWTYHPSITACLAGDAHASNFKCTLGLNLFTLKHHDAVISLSLALLRYGAIHTITYNQPLISLMQIYSFRLDYDLWRNVVQTLDQNNHSETLDLETYNILWAFYKSYQNEYFHPGQYAELVKETKHMMITHFF